MLRLQLLLLLLLQHLLLLLLGRRRRRAEGSRCGCLQRCLLVRERQVVRRRPLHRHDLTQHGTVVEGGRRRKSAAATAAAAHLVLLLLLLLLLSGCHLLVGGRHVLAHRCGERRLLLLLLQHGRLGFEGGDVLRDVRPLPRDASRLLRRQLLRGGDASHAVRLHSGDTKT